MDIIEAFSRTIVTWAIVHGEKVNKHRKIYYNETKSLLVRIGLYAQEIFLNVLKVSAYTYKGEVKSRFSSKYVKKKDLQHFAFCYEIQGAD